MQEDEIKQFRKGLKVVLDGCLIGVGLAVVLFIGLVVYIAFFGGA